MVNTNMFEFKHPKYYKELRSIRNKLDQVISSKNRDGECERAPGPGLKPQASSSKPQAASSDKPQATSSPASSDKPQAPGRKAQASSHKHQAPGYPSPHKVL